MEKENEFSCILATILFQSVNTRIFVYIGKNISFKKVLLYTSHHMFFDVFIYVFLCGLMLDLIKNLAIILIVGTYNSTIKMLTTKKT